MSDLRARIEGYINHEQPFGPFKAEAMSDDADALQLLFDETNKLHRVSLTTRPTLIVGRKGSGKTAFVRAPLRAENAVVLELRSPTVYKEVDDTLHALREYGTLFVDHVASLWEGLISNCMCLAVAQASHLVPAGPLRTAVCDYVDAVEPAGDADDFLRELMARLRSIARSDALSDPMLLLRRLSFGGVSYYAAADAAREIIRREHLDVYIVMDSLEDLQERLSSLNDVLRGLFNFIGRHNDIPADAKRYNLRVCFPSELWGYLSQISSNANKDFEQHMVLFWHARELTAIAGRRLYLYLRAFHEPLLLERFRRSDYDFGDVEHARDLMLAFFPREIQNKHGQTEDFFGYILRHTQLLPRQLLRILNAVMAQNRGRDNTIEEVSQDAVRHGIVDAEKLMIDECIAAFDSVYPGADSACERAIPDLHRQFSSAELEAVYRKNHVARAGFNDFEHFRSMLLDIGAVGRVVDETRRYAVGEFSYTLPKKLLVSSSDRLCLHPLFSQVYSNLDLKVTGTPKHLPVYPYGTSIEESDYRPALSMFGF